ncbi:SusC/RagA family TonB-linked outer membrane protein [Sediminibacterium sp.]|uniref:SusC/RagA family TonB-linked outer membrane protein n=1 Tax=Sediminibacterium sp. TaxID=1917865 RepID=UPI0025F1853A|nr:SusC/RagA family TonB-linked outer membrane protein [Sediminibacterium sp.]MBW0176862.1 SusC/RagA family TonB-linked outer membrane protein [Sediminibacterium sp.]
MNLSKLVRPTLVGLLACVFTLFAQAQTKTVTGKVTDSKDGSPLAGASVLVKGSTTGTQTGADGTFKLSVPSSARTVTISFSGYSAVDVNISSSNTANASLTATADALADVVVIGYGTRKSKDVTGSVSRVTEKDFNKGQIASPEQLLQGRTAGVLVTPSTGEPGAAATINIRGTGSISGAQEPLYVIDGVPLIQGGTLGTNGSGVEGGTSAKNPLIFLNPTDIESITVLKDASAAAIYGSRGANGVILITTKQGKGGKGGVFSYGASTTIAKTARRYDLMNAQDFLLAAKKANIDGGANPIAAEAAVVSIDKGANTDWQDEIFRTAISQNHNLSWSMSSKGTTARISGSYDNQEGIVKNTGLKRLTGRANLSQKLLNEKLKLEANVTMSRTENSYAPLSNNAGYQGSLLGAALQFNPTNPVYNPDGSFYQPGDQRNPSQMLAYFTDNDEINRFLGNFSASYQITKDLSYKVVLGLDNSKAERISFADPRLGTGAYGGTINVFGKDYGNQIQGNGRTTKQNLETKSQLIEHYLTYDKTFNNKHAVNAIAGYSYQSFENRYKAAFGWGVKTPVVGPKDVFVKDYAAFNNYANFVPGYDRNELQSIFGRLNYTYNDKYFLTVTVRSDGSSKFGSNNRYATFPAFAFKWRVLEESWAQKAFGGFLSDLSFRANYGKLGSQDNLGSYASLNLQQTFDVGAGPVTRFIQQGNPNLKWEEVATTGVGVDFTTKDRRLSVTVDYYNNKRTNMLFFAPTPGGFAPTANWWINLDGEVINKGWEASVNYRAIQGKKFSWDINYNMTTVNNNIEGLPTPINTGGVSGQGLTGAFAQTLTNGSPIFTWSMPVFNGFDGNGNARYGNGASNQLVGSALPKFFAGLTNNFSYGRWNLSVFVNAITGFHVYNNTANALFLKGSLRNARNVTNAVGKGPENPFNPGSVSTRFLEKGDFIRLANVNLSYAFNLKKTSLFKSMSIYASGQNLALISGYSGIDPEVNVDKSINGIPSRGFDYTQYPRPRVITVGVNVGF